MRMVHLHTYTRRGFFRVIGGACAAASCRIAWGGPFDQARVRATSGDTVEPKWENRLTVTVGPQKANLIGTDHRVLQAAVDYVASLGGGTVQVLPGTYRLRNAVYLRSKVRITGSGEDAILLKEPSFTTKLAADSDWYDQEITLSDAKGFQLGDGVCLRTRNPHHGGTDIAKRTLVAQNGNRFKLDRALRENFWLKGETTVSSLFPLVDGENVTDIAIENLVLDGNRAHNENLDGNYAGCIFLQDSSRVAIRGVTARNYNGDGISWQVAHDVLVEGCRSHDHAGLGLHPGSGSQRAVIRGNTLRRNAIGLFFCWGVKFAVVEGNTIEDSLQTGISIGHRDTDNLIRKNVVRRSGEVGVLFRPEPGKGYAPHRNRLEANRIEDSGPESGVGIDVQGFTEGVTVAQNEIHEKRGPAKRTGIRISADTRNFRLDGNRIEGVAVPVADLRKT
ncbi:MAG: right-handed parallel beta-helix repeat-containing protein [Thermoguttaceae bacterium]